MMLVRRSGIVTLAVSCGVLLMVNFFSLPETKTIDFGRWCSSSGGGGRPPTGLGSSLAGDDVPPLNGEDRQCEPRRSIFFLKTHKCGSSTVQNILLRHGERHSLDFVLPSRGIYLGSPEPFAARLIPEELRPRTGRFHVFTHHTRLNVAETRRVMQPDTAWITILRDPVTRFESAYDYNSFGTLFNKTLKEFIALPLAKKQELSRNMTWLLQANQMAFDLGYDPNTAAEPLLVNPMLDDLERTFDLVMILELMDESLVLLRRLMCWSTDDVTYLIRNARFEERRTRLNAKQRAALEKFLALDVMLYRHFRDRLVRQMAAVPLEAFLAQAETLVARRLFWRQRCVADVVSGAKLSGRQYEINEKVKGYKLNDGTDWMCSRLGMAEHGYTNLVRDTQRDRLAVWHRLYPLMGLNRSTLSSGDG